MKEFEQCPTPDSLKPKEFENLILSAGERLEGMCIGRYGVQVSYMADRLVAIPSLPDFEGVLEGGRQFIIEAKVVSNGMLAMNTSKVKPRQVRHMLERHEMGSLCYFLIHFCKRVLKTKVVSAFTVAVPITFPAFTEFDKNGATNGIDLDTAILAGTIVPWVRSRRMKNCVPDLRSFLLK